jgi:hypothetical protein
MRSSWNRRTSTDSKDSRGEVTGGRSSTRATGDDCWPFGESVWPNGLSHATRPIRTIRGTNGIPRKGPSPEEAAHMNTHFALVRVAFAAAAALFIFIIVHAALQGISSSAGVLAGLQ